MPLALQDVVQCPRSLADLSRHVSEKPPLDDNVRARGFTIRLRRTRYTSPPLPRRARMGNAWRSSTCAPLK